MIGYIIFFIVAMIGLSILYNLDSDRNDALSRRKKQTKDMFRGNVLKDKIDEVVNERIKYSKRKKMESMLVQAGFNASYAEYLVVCIGSAILMSLISGYLLSNILLAILFLFFGFFAPLQVVSFLRNRRIAILEKQIGAFMQMVIKRYENTRDLNKALEMTSVEFEGEDPLDTELKKTILEIDLGVPVVKALKNLASRTGNKYMERFASYYEVASGVGTDDLRKNLLNQAYEQYKENLQMKRLLKKEISGPVQEAYIMIITVPIFAIYQVATNPDYPAFMTTTNMGRMGTTVIIGVLIGIIWFVNAKLGAPLD